MDLAPETNTTISLLWCNRLLAVHRLQRWGWAQASNPLEGRWDKYSPRYRCLDGISSSESNLVIERRGIPFECSGLWEVDEDTRFRRQKKNETSLLCICLWWVIRKSHWAPSSGSMVRVKLSRSSGLGKKTFMVLGSESSVRSMNISKC